MMLDEPVCIIPYLALRMTAAILNIAMQVALIHLASYQTESWIALEKVYLVQKICSFANLLISLPKIKNR